MTQVPDQPDPLPQSDPLERILEHLFDPGLDIEQWGELRQLLAASPAARARYVRWIDLHSTLTWETGGADARLWILELESSERNVNVLDETMVLPALQGEEREFESPAIDPRNPPFWMTPRKQAATRRRKPGQNARPWRMAAAVMIVILSAVVIAIFQATKTTPSPDKSALVVKPVEPPIVALVTKQVDARWDGPDTPEGAALHASRTFKLATGYAEIRFVNGAKFVVEGPTEFTLSSATEMAVKAGRLSATVEGGGFVVSTPTARILDLGTEFGIGVGEDRKTEVAVFKGKVETALPASGGSEAKHSMVLTTGQAALVAKNDIQVDKAGANVQRYVRNLSTETTRLDIVDLISGGDGTTHRRGIAVDPLTGNAGPLKPAEMYTGDHHYHPVTSIPVLDGCFVPDDSKGPEPVDSAGHTFTFPASANGGFNHIWTGGSIPDLREVMPTLLGPIDYAKPDHALLSMHSNKGITLNLNAIRRLHPGVRLARLHSVVGNTHVEAASDTWHPNAEAWVLVDGVPRFTTGKFVPTAGAIPVDVPLSDDDRFITLAVTDGEDGTTYDWILWGDPQFDLVAR